MDSLAYYVPSSSDGVTDKFRFKIVMPTYLDNGGTLQFAIKYCVGGQEYWDNNNGNNYKVRRHRLKMSPPREWENGWIHFIWALASFARNWSPGTLIMTVAC